MEKESWGEDQCRHEWRPALLPRQTSDAAHLRPLVNGSELAAGGHGQAAYRDGLRLAIFHRARSLPSV